MPHSISSMPIIIFVRSHYKISPKRTVYKVHTHYYKKKIAKIKHVFAVPITLNLCIRPVKRVERTVRIIILKLSLAW